MRRAATPARPNRPPHLAAILPWEGASDHYRDMSYHGGILSDGFFERTTTMRTGQQPEPQASPGSAPERGRRPRSCSR